MQFVRNGPDIPERLLQAHEDGRVVFFCGAGISYPAHLPGFSGLVEKLFDAVGEEPNTVQQTAINAKQFDTAIGLLEAAVGRETVRRELAMVLEPDLSATNATATHEALMKLGKCRDGRTRLITTNFDRLFEQVISKNASLVECFEAPLLPVPKNRWDGLVYLHGLLPEKPTSSKLDRLVISSGDFGLAYLTERWAARFVSELFRNYTVCFVGYSITDPVLRYMMDALAADRLLGESPPEMFAFGSFSKGKEVNVESEWRAKNVTPILYREHKNHFYLHKTLRTWADTYRDGLRGKERIIVESAITRPMLSTVQDNFVGRLLWALSDPQGLPAKRFSELEPAPSLDWLMPLCEERYKQVDLNRFGVQPKLVIDNKLSFSLTRRPPPYDLAPRMVLVSSEAHHTRWDKIMSHLANWLLRHLDDPVLLLWIVKQGGKLHNDFKWALERRLDEISKFEHDGNHDELNRIRLNSPNAIPRPIMRNLWSLMLNGRIKSSGFVSDLYVWLDRFKRDGLTASLRLNLREILTPRVELREPFLQIKNKVEPDDLQIINDLVDWEIVLSAESVHSSLHDLAKNIEWTRALPELLVDFTGLLKDACDLMQELGGADKTSDLSYISQPSVSEHPQNNDYHEWTALIELTRNAWLSTNALHPELALIAAKAWWLIPYPIFKRLAFFAAAQSSTIPTRLALDWILAYNNHWLWSVETQREVMRLLVTLAPNLDADLLNELELAILAGPPREMFIDDIEPERWSRIIERETWLRLAKIKRAQVVLGETAKKRLDDLTHLHPEWLLAEDERDEFPTWSGSGDEWTKFVATPRRRKELVVWLKNNAIRDHWQQDDWRQRCRDNFSTTATALCALAAEDIWPVERWKEALQAWSEEKLIIRSWRYLAPVLASAPPNLTQQLAYGISWWLKAIAMKLNSNEKLFLELCQRILAIDFPKEINIKDHVTTAINHPIGNVTEALLHFWYKTSPEDGQTLDGELGEIFTKLSNTQIYIFRHARVLLAAHAIALFRVDPIWAEKHLLPLFNWQQLTDEAKSAWEGLLWSPRLYRPFMEAIKEPFLDTARHYSQLGRHKGQYAALLTFTALDPEDTFTKLELINATRALPLAGLEESSKSLVLALEGAGDQKSEFWRNRIAPYIQSIWPKSQENTSKIISDNFARLCLATQDAFPEALSMLKKWLLPPDYPNFLVERLRKSDLCQQYPEQALSFLDKITTNDPRWPASNLGECLETIKLADPTLCIDSRFERLNYINQSN